MVAYELSPSSVHLDPTCSDDTLLFPKVLTEGSQWHRMLVLSHFHLPTYSVYFFYQFSKSMFMSEFAHKNQRCLCAPHVEAHSFQSSTPQLHPVLTKCAVFLVFLSILTLKATLSLLCCPQQLKAFQHGLSSIDCSRNVYVKKNGFTLHRNPIAQSTDGARGKIGFSEGRHAWEIWWEGPLGTVAVIGIATKRAPMQCQGYVALLGSDDQSWGWNLVDNNLLHNGEVNGNYPQCNNAPKYQVGAAYPVASFTRSDSWCNAGLPWGLSVCRSASGYESFWTWTTRH